MKTNEEFGQFIEYLERYDVGLRSSVPGKLINPVYEKEQRFKTGFDLLFDGVEIEGKKVLDIGAGSGVHTLYAVYRGADNVVALEPEAEGSITGTFEKLSAIAESHSNIRAENATFQEYNLDEAFDVILSASSINHLDEQACKRLHRAENARETYHRIFSKFNSAAKPDATLIVSDASRHNFFKRLGIPNPVARNIDWNIHQQPQLWSSMLEEHGFVQTDITWPTYFSSLGYVGERLFTNRIASYLTNSSFVLKFRKE